MNHLTEDYFLRRAKQIVIMNDIKLTEYEEENFNAIIGRMITNVYNLKALFWVVVTQFDELVKAEFNKRGRNVSIKTYNFAHY